MGDTQDPRPRTLKVGTKTQDLKPTTQLIIGTQDPEGGIWDQRDPEPLLNISLETQDPGPENLMVGETNISYWSELNQMP